MAKKDKAAKGKEAKGSSTKDCAPKEKKNRKQERVKGRKGGGWDNGSEDNLQEELAAVGLRVKDVTGDGNCFFRACSDQLEHVPTLPSQGSDSLHSSLRQQVVQHIRDNEEQFSPFVEDDETFEVYCKRMGKDGIWAGQMELVAASQVLRCSFTIYQSGQPRWTIQYEPPLVESAKAAPAKAVSTAKPSQSKASTAVAPTPHMLHLSYHDGMHYNSVRMLDDFGSGPPEPVELCQQKPSTGENSKESALTAQSQQEKQVARSTGCWDKDVIRNALKEADNNIDEAIETVVEWMGNHSEATPADTPSPILASSIPIPLPHTACDSSPCASSSVQNFKAGESSDTVTTSSPETTTQAAGASNSQGSGSQSDADAEAGSGNVSGSDGSDSQLQQSHENGQAVTSSRSCTDDAISSPVCSGVITPVGDDLDTSTSQEGHSEVLEGAVQAQAKGPVFGGVAMASTPLPLAEQQHRFLWDVPASRGPESNSTLDICKPKACLAVQSNAAGREAPASLAESQPGSENAAVNVSEGSPHSQPTDAAPHVSSSASSSTQRSNSHQQVPVQQSANIVEASPHNHAAPTQSSSSGCAEAPGIDPAASSLNCSPSPSSASTPFTTTEDSVPACSACDKAVSGSTSQTDATAYAVLCPADSKQSESNVPEPFLEPKDGSNADMTSDLSTGSGARKGGARKVHVASTVKVKPAGNKVCPCGSKKKYKSCCGPAAAAAARRSKAAGGDGETSAGCEAKVVQADGGGKRVLVGVSAAATQMGNLML